MLRKLIAFAITSGLAKKAWDHFQTTRKARQTPAGRTRRSVSDVTARPVAAGKPAAKATPRKTTRSAAARDRKPGPATA